MLGGGNSNIFYCYPWGNDQIWWEYFSDGWLNHHLEWMRLWGFFTEKPPRWVRKISGELLRSHDLRHGCGGGVRCGQRWPTNEQRTTTNNQPPVTNQKHQTKICTWLFFTCYFEWFSFKALLFERLSPSLFLLIFFQRLRGVHIFAVWQPFFCRQ